MTRHCFIVYYHFFLYAVLIVSDAVIPSAAAWNFSFVPHGPLASVDAYMIFLGCFSLLVVFPIFFADLFAHAPFTSTVRVECAWVALLLLFHFPGAVASSTLLANVCGPTLPNGIVDSADACRSSRLLQAFAWICTVNLVLFLATLSAAAVLHARTDAAVWRTHVRRVDWRAHLCRLGSAPSSPVRAAFNADGMVAAPAPRRAFIPRTTPPPLEERYRIEHLSETLSHSLHAHAALMDEDAGTTVRQGDVVDAYVPQRTNAAAKRASRRVSQDNATLYPSPVRSSARNSHDVHKHTFPPEQPPSPIRPVPSRTRSVSSPTVPLLDKGEGKELVPPPPLVSTSATALHAPEPSKQRPERVSRAQESPPLLGDWPRHDVMNRPPPPLKRTRVRTGSSPVAASASSGPQPRPARPLPTHASSAPAAQSVLGSAQVDFTPAPIPRRPAAPPHAPRLTPLPSVTSFAVDVSRIAPSDVPRPSNAPHAAPPDAIPPSDGPRAAPSAFPQTLARPRRPAGPRSSLEAVILPASRDR